MTVNDSQEIDMPFCSGAYFPITCIQYDNGELQEVLDHMQSEENVYNPVFVSDGDHKKLIKALNDLNPLSFAGNQVWAMSLENTHFLHLRLDNNILFYAEAASGGFSVYESYSVKGGSPTTSQLFEWRKAEDQKNSKRPIRLLERRWNLNGVMIKNAAIKYNDDIYTDLLSELQVQLNFNIQTVEPNKIQTWGKLKNGTWSGLVGMLFDKRIDLTEGWMIISADRTIGLGYSWATSVRVFTLCTAKTTRKKINVMAYAKVFPADVLLIALTLSIVTVICFSVLSHESIWQSLTLMLRLLIQIGYDLPVKNRPSKMVLLVAAVYTYLFFVYYSGDLTAKMTSEPAKLNIRSFEDVETEGYKVMISAIGHTDYKIIKNAPEGSAMRRIFDAGDILVEPDDWADDMGQMPPKTVFFAPPTTCEKKFINCVPLDIVDKVSFFKALAFQKDSEFIALFNHYILRMKENGVIAALKKRRWGKHDKDYEMVEPFELGYDNVLFPYAWLAFGVIIAVSLVFGEVIVKKQARSLRLK